MRFHRLFLDYDICERHAIVSQLLRETIDSAWADIGILDVGGRAESLEKFLPYRVVSINVDGSGNLWGNGCALPFVDGSFTAVVSIDTLEHLPPGQRLSLLQECLRVARHCIVVAAPFGSEAHKAREKQLDSLHRSVLGHPHTYLSEHVQYGLPGKRELDRLVCDLNAPSSRYLFAGNYVWQSRQFERAILANRKRGWIRRLLNLYHRVTLLALFHPVQSQEQPDAKTNRFYLVAQK